MKPGAPGPLGAQLKARPWSLGRERADEAAAIAPQLHQRKSRLRNFLNGKR